LFDEGESRRSGPTYRWEGFQDRQHVDSSYGAVLFAGTTWDAALSLRC
jgi:hypothetical protein